MRIRLSWNRGSWTIEPTLMLRYKSAALNDYYWGVRAAEASSALPVYVASSGLNWQLGARTNYYLSSHLRLAASVNYERHERCDGGKSPGPRT